MQFTILKMLALSVAAAVIVAAFFYALYAWSQGGSEIVSEFGAYSPPTAYNGVAYDGLTANSPSFPLALQFAKNKDYIKAREYYVKAAQETTDAVQLSIIRFQMAVLRAEEGKYLEAIDELKALIKDEKTPALTRAYSFLEFGLMYYRFADSAITERIFEGDVYYRALRDIDERVTYRRIFEESARLYPLALAEYRIADWYATELFNAEHGGPSIGNEIKAEYTQILEGRWNAGEQDFERIKLIPSEYARYGPQSLLRASIISGKMSALGNSSYGDVEERFERAFAAYASRPGSDGYVRFHYAVALAKMPTSASSDRIELILAPFYTQGSVYKDTSVISFFRNEKNNVLEVKQDLVMLAAIDSRFREFLVSLGWDSTDFPA